MLKKEIVVALSEDLISFFNEIKFLNLFFDKLHLLTSTTRLEWLDPDLISSFKKGHKLITNPWGTSNLIHPEILEFSEFKELFEQGNLIRCIVVNSGPKEEKFGTNEEQHYLISEILDFYKPESHLPAGLQFLADNPSNLIGVRSLFGLQLSRLIGAFEVALENDIQIVWSTPFDKKLASIFFSYVCEKACNKGSFSPSISQRMKASDFLREIYSAEVVNVTDVPIDRLFDFKKRNRDLLDQFMEELEGFYLAVLSNESDSEIEAKKRLLEVKRSLRNINNEIKTIKARSLNDFLKDLVPSFALSFSFFFCLLKNIPGPEIPMLSTSTAIVGSAFYNWLKARIDIKKAVLSSNYSYLWKASKKI